ncbi:hypothetical protein ID007_004331 [Salmonella enterica]|nr:hypothetical protein [Salmonella enterica]
MLTKAEHSAAVDRAEYLFDHEDFGPEFKRLCAQIEEYEANAPEFVEFYSRADELTLADVLEKISPAHTLPQKMLAFCRCIVDLFDDEGGIAAYKILSKALDNDLPEDVEEAVTDALEALSGQCNAACQIGSGDYHLPRKREKLREMVLEGLNSPVSNSTVTDIVERVLKDAH